MLVSLNWLKDFVSVNVSSVELAHRLTMSGFEIEGTSVSGDDTIFDINVTPNRGDCLSIIGIAREIAAIFGKQIKAEKKRNKDKGGKSVKQLLKVEIKNKQKCLRYTAQVIEGVTIGPSPDWVADRLNACGIRPINNVVDATNYMMLETGQPFHAFDYRYIRGQKIIVDTPSSAMTFKTLDGTERKILPDDLLICDAEGPVALAGVMGGENSEVKNDTTTIVLESACFHPTTVRKTAKRLALNSESSRRFEKMVDPNATDLSLAKLTNLILEIAGGEATRDIVDIYPKPIKPIKIKYNLNDANKLLGLDIKPVFLKKCFNALGLGVVGNVCIVPTYRPDLTRDADLYEELARLYGYDNIPVTLPKQDMVRPERPLALLATDKAKEFLTSHGFYEAINYGFCSPKEIEPFTEVKPVEIANPLGIEFSAMKSTLIPGLLQNLNHNKNFGRESVRLFEIRPVFLPEQELSLCALMYGKRSDLGWTQKQQDVDFFDIKGIVEGLAKQINIDSIKFEKSDIKFLHPEASAKILINGKFAGFLGLMHPSIAENVHIFELKWYVWVMASRQVKKTFRALPKFPTVRRDVALLVGEDVESANILATITSSNAKIIKNVVPFDVYKGKGIPPGKKSMAFAIIYSDPERTLTDEEVNGAHANVVSLLKDKLGAEIR